MRKGRISNLSSPSNVLITLRHTSFPLLFSRPLRGKRKHILEGLRSSKMGLELEWKNVKCSALYPGGWENWKSFLCSAEREFLIAWHSLGQDNALQIPLNYLHIPVAWINVAVICLAGWEWTQTCRDSYHITVQSLWARDGRRAPRRRRQYLQAVSIYRSRPRDQCNCHVSGHPSPA